MTNREAFRGNINRLIDKFHCTQQDIATYTGASLPAVSSWVTGSAYPRADTMEKIAKYFGVSVFELVCGEAPDENALLRAFRVLSPEGRKKAIERMEELKQLYWYE